MIIYKIHYLLSVNGFLKEEETYSTKNFAFIRIKNQIYIINWAIFIQLTQEIKSDELTVLRQEFALEFKSRNLSYS